MTTLFRSRIVKIGNSHGIRIPKLLLRQVGLVGEVEVEAQADQLVIRPVKVARQNWEQAFAEMAKAGDDRLLDRDSILLTIWEANEWE